MNNKEIITIDTDQLVQTVQKQNIEYEPFEVLGENSKILTKVCLPFEFGNGDIHPEIFSERLKSTVKKYKAYGVAAPQVGFLFRVFCMGYGEDYYTIFNPEIVEISDVETLMEEGCLSFPGLLLNIKRPTTVTIKYQNELGIYQTGSFCGISARVILHEIDHLNGICFTKVAKPLALKMSLEKRRKLFKRASRAGLI